MTRSRSPPRQLPSPATRRHQVRRAVRDCRPSRSLDSTRCGADRSELRSSHDRTEIRPLGVGPGASPFPSPRAIVETEAAATSRSVPDEASSIQNLVERTWRRFSLPVRHSCSPHARRRRRCREALKTAPSRSSTGFQNRPTRPAGVSPKLGRRPPGPPPSGKIPSGYVMKAVTSPDSVQAESDCG